MASTVTRHRHPRAGVSVSIGLLSVLIVLFAVVLTFALNNDERADRDTAPASPLSYYVEGAGEGWIGGSQHAVVPALEAHTGEFQGEGRMNTPGGLSVNRPMSRYEEYAAEGRLTGNLDAGDILSTDEQARLAHDEMLFNEWNEPLGWQATSEPVAVMSYQDILFLEQNGVYGDVVIGETPKLATVDPIAWMRFIEVNTNLPGWTEGATLASDRPGFTQF